MVAGIRRLGMSAFPEQRRSDRVHREGDDEQRHAAVGHHRTGQHDGQDRPPGSQPGDDGIGQHPGAAGVLHQLAEDRAEQEHREIQGDEVARRAHEDLRIARQHRAIHRGDHGEGRQRRSEDQDANAPVGQIHQQTQGDQDDEYADQGFGSLGGSVEVASSRLGGRKLSVNRLFRSKVERTPRSSK